MMKISDIINNSCSHYIAYRLRYEDEEVTLSKCPRCNGEAKIVFSSERDSNCSYNTAYVKCIACKVRTESRTIDGYYGDESTINDVIKDWNY